MRRQWLGSVIALAGALAGACSAPRELHDLVYDDRHPTADTMDLYLPEGDAGGGDHAHATVFLIHGGAWKGGDKDEFEDVGQRLARSGFVAASANYRLLPDGQFPANARDVLCAYGYLRAHAADYAIDPDRIVVMGYSAGGHLAGIVGLESEEPALAPDCAEAAGQALPPPLAVINASGPQDMVELHGEIGTASTIEDLLGGTPSEVPDVYALASPIQHVRRGGEPWLVIEDGFDWGGIVAMNQTLKAAGVETSLLKIVGSLHVLEQFAEPGEYAYASTSDTPEAWIAVESFLFDHVGTP